MRGPEKIPTTFFGVAASNFAGSGIRGILPSFASPDRTRQPWFHSRWRSDFQPPVPYPPCAQFSPLAWPIDTPEFGGWKPPLRFGGNLLLSVLKNRGADEPVRVQAGGTLEEMVDGLDDFQVGKLMRRKRVHLVCGYVTLPLVPDGKRHGKGDFAYNRRSHRIAGIIADRPRKGNAVAVRRSSAASQMSWRA